MPSPGAQTPASTPPAPSARSAWTGLYLLAIAVFAAITSEVVPIGLLPQVVSSLGVNEAGAGTLISLYAGMVAVTAVPLTRLTRRIPRKPLLLATLIVFALSNTLAAAAPDFVWLAVARALGGAAHALFFAVAIGYAARIAPRGQTGRALALVATGTSVGLILGVPAGTVLGELFSWRATFGALAVIVALATLAAVRYLPAVEHDAEAGKSLLPGGGTLLLVAGLAGAAFLGHYSLYTYVSPFLLAAGLPAAWLGAMLAVLGLSGLVGIRIAARRLDAHPYAWLVAVPSAVLLTQAALALSFPSLIPVLILAALWTASFGPVNSTYQSVLVRVGKDNPEMAGAWINVTCNIGIAVGSTLGGTLLTGTGGYTSAGLAGCAVLAAAVLVTLLAKARLLGTSRG